MDSLLLEIGTEEIPAGYIEPALKALSSMLLKKLTEARIDHGNARIYGTPRRLAVKVEAVADKQTALTEEVMGPPERIGFDQQGNPMVPAKKFAEKVGIPVNRIQIKETQKGRYLCATKTDRGLATRTVLKNILPQVILSTPFPKTMRWADLDTHFARPIHSILALLGEKLVSFEVGNIKSGRFTSGHRFMHPKKIIINQPGQYLEALHSGYVIADVERRKNEVEKEIEKAANALGGKVLPDSELVDIVTNLIEYPAVSAGKFDTKYLELPSEVLITAMREHQKYFAVVDENQRLMPCFIAVNNTPVKDMALVAKGHERVLRARLEDAQFFYKSDLKTSFDGWIEKLKGVLFQAKLGSMHAKVLRVKQLVEFLADTLGVDPDIKSQVSKAAWMCKADLVSQVVGEFPKLQGVMGRIYAHLEKEPDAVSAAIEEHYRPTYSGGVLPETLTGAMLSIADKIDSICGCFSAGLIPTGASDPYALRRQGIGIIQILLDKGFSFSLSELIAKSAKHFEGENHQDIKEIADKVYTFLVNRMSHILAEEGFSKDVIAAVLSVSAFQVPDVWNRVRALEKLKREPDFQPLAIAFKRVVNIIKKEGMADAEMGDVKESLFEDPCESDLYAAYQKVSQKVADDLQQGSIDQALLQIATLRDAVDAYFDGVMVMTDNAIIRDNRLNLLRHVAGLFERLADFSKITT